MFQKLDIPILVLLFILFLTGIVSIYTASATKIGDEYHFKSYYLKQIFFMILALTVGIIIIKIPYHIFDFFIYPFYFFSLILLFVVLFLPEINGSHRWISLGGLRLQPSEPAKILTILVIAKSISEKQLTELNILGRALMATIPPMFLIFIEPDLGTSLIFLSSMITILSFSDLPKYYIIMMISPIFSVITAFYWPLFLVFIIVLIFTLYKMKLSYFFISILSIFNTFIFFMIPVLWNGLKEYQQNRILTFLDPTRDPLGAGYQIIQSKIAIGSGMTFGKGILQGTQKNLNFLPEHHTDFIFSVIGEEFGFIGGFFIILLFFLFLMRILSITFQIEDKENRLACIGILFYLTFQVFINIGMNLGVVPTTGIPLPFISYGGSSLIINTIAIALVLKFKIRRSS